MSTTAITQMFCTLCMQRVTVPSKRHGLKDHILKEHPAAQKKMFDRCGSAPKERVEQVNAELASLKINKSKGKGKTAQNASQIDTEKADVTQSEIQYLEQSGFSCSQCHLDFYSVKKWIHHKQQNKCCRTKAL